MQNRNRNQNRNQNKKQNQKQLEASDIMAKICELKLDCKRMHVGEQCISGAFNVCMLQCMPVQKRFGFANDRLTVSVTLFSSQMHTSMRGQSLHDFWLCTIFNSYVYVLNQQQIS